MRTFVLLIGLTITLSTRAQTSVYHPFPDSNAVWNIYFRDAFVFNSSQRYSYIITGDTVINSITYHKLEIPFVIAQFNPFPQGYAGAIRQNIPAKKIFYVVPNDSIEQLLYDFNLQVGDTIHRYVTNFYNGCSEDPQKVYAIDSVLVGSTYRKRWQVSPYFRTPPYFIEGIGSAVGLLEPICRVSSDSPDYFLSCFSQDNIPLYHPDSVFYGMFSCDAILSTTNLLEKNISATLSPNPFHTSAKLSINGMSRVFKMYDTLGKLVREEIISNESTTIYRHSLPDGIYFYQLISAEGQTTSGKFVVD